MAQSPPNRRNLGLLLLAGGAIVFGVAVFDWFFVPSATVLTFVPGVAGLIAVGVAIAILWNSRKRSRRQATNTGDNL